MIPSMPVSVPSCTISRKLIRLVSLRPEGGRLARKMISLLVSRSSLGIHLFESADGPPLAGWHPFICIYASDLRRTRGIPGFKFGLSFRTAL